MYVTAQDSETAQGGKWIKGTGVGAEYYKRESLFSCAQCLMLRVKSRVSLPVGQ